MTSSSRRTLEMLAKEAGNTADGIKLYQSVEVMALVRVDLHFVWDVVGFEQLLQFISLCYWNNRVTSPMKDEYRRKLCRVIGKVCRQAAKEFGHGGDAAVLCSQRDGQVSPKEKPSIPILRGSTPGCLLM
jgi:hypothetical protein